MSQPAKAEECSPPCTITGATPELNLVDTNGDDWSLETAGDDLVIKNVTESDTPLFIDGLAPSFALFIDDVGWIGLGTSVPQASIHIPSPLPKIRFEDTSVGDIGQFDLSLNGNNVRFEGNSGVDIIEFDSRAPETIDIDGTGATVIFGDLSLNSSRDAKDDIETVDGGEVLANLAALPIHRWRYKTESDEVEHLGPMAEDFHAAFGLGRSDKSISVVDSAGVALAAVQALALRVESLAAENAHLRDELERRLPQLEGGCAAGLRKP